MRAVYEGLCFAARDCYAAMGAAPEEVRVAGGAARSLALRRILASVLDPAFAPWHARRPAQPARR